MGASVFCLDHLLRKSNIKCNTKSVAMACAERYNQINKRGGNMVFEWDEEKNKTNLKKHGIDFETAAFVFCDNDRLEYYDEEHSTLEDRFITIGEIKEVLIVLVVVYTERKEAIRIISARKANNRERREYYGR